MKTMSWHQKVWILVSIITGWILWGILTGSVWYYEYNNPSILTSILVTKVFQCIGGILMSIAFYPILAGFWKYGGSIKKQIIYLPFLIYFFSFAFAFIYWLIYRQMFDLKPLVMSLSYYLIMSFDKFFVLSFFTLIFYLYQYWQEVQLQRETVLKATAEAKQAQLQMLQYQLNPHFLFNALNTIRTIMYEDCKRADNMITDVAGILRYSLTEDNIHLVPIQSEIEVIRSYLNIQQIRFEENLIIIYDIHPETLNLHIPAFLIHPLVENSVKYGMHTGTLPLQIRIQSFIENELLVIRVLNSGRIFKKEDYPELQLSGTGTGHKNIQNRLEHFFPEHFSFDFFEEEGWVHTIIKISSDLVKENI